MYWNGARASERMGIRMSWLGSYRIHYNLRIIHMIHTVGFFLWLGSVLCYPYPSGLLHWHCGNHPIVLVPVEQFEGYGFVIHINPPKVIKPPKPNYAQQNDAYILWNIYCHPSEICCTKQCFGSTFSLFILPVRVGFQACGVLRKWCFDINITINTSTVQLIYWWHIY